MYNWRKELKGISRLQNNPGAVSARIGLYFKWYRAYRQLFLLALSQGDFTMITLPLESLPFVGRGHVCREIAPGKKNTIFKKPESWHPYLCLCSFAMYRSPTCLRCSNISRMYVSLTSVRNVWSTSVDKSLLIVDVINLRAKWANTERNVGDGRQEWNKIENQMRWNEDRIT